MDYNEAETKLAEIVGLMQERKVNAVLGGKYRLKTLVHESTGARNVSLYRNSSDEVGISDPDEYDRYPYMVRLSRDTVGKEWGIEDYMWGDLDCAFYMPMEYDLSFFLSDYEAIKAELTN